MMHKLNGMVFAAVTGAMVCGFFGSDAQSAVDSYRAVDLTPAGYDYDCQALGVYGTQQVGVGSGTETGYLHHALLWNSAANGFIDLNAPGYRSSYAFGASVNQQVGECETSGGYPHASLWRGTAASMVDLNRSGLTGSYALATSGTKQVGYGLGTWTNNNNHALIWSGTANSCVDMHPSRFDNSYALDISGNQQVGYGSPSSVARDHALLWQGTAASAVDINPTAKGFECSKASGTSGNQQVGSGYGTATGGYERFHALLWTGTAASAVDLHPSGFNLSYATDTNGTQQVGYGYIGSYPNGYNHALLWSGTAASAIDLEQFLPSGLRYSTANSIDAQGNIVGSAFDTYGKTHAILWVAVPEPSTVVLLGMGVFGILVWGWRRHWQDASGTQSRDRGFEIAKCKLQIAN
jgi:hypothetical protein